MTGLGDMNIGFLTSKDYVKPPSQPVPKGERSAEGGAWCVALMPVIGLLIENIETFDKYSGAALWLMVIFFIWFGCIADLRQISDNLPAEHTAQLWKLRFLPPLYLYKRDKLRTGEGLRGIVLAILMAGAVFGNGFTQGLMVNDNTLAEKLENTSVTTLNNYSRETGCTATVQEQLEKWFPDGYESSCTHKGEVFSVVYSGKHDGSVCAVTVEVVHDGFVYKSLKAAGYSTDGKALEDDELKDKLYEVFIGEKKEDESVSDGSTTADENSDTDDINRE